MLCVLRPLAALAFICTLLAGVPRVSAQGAPFSIEVTERTDLVNAPALHSGAWAEHDGKWLFVSGRTNGLHSFGADAFPRAFENGDVVVYEIATDTQWSANLDGLPVAIAEPLRSTNPQFLARGDSLIVVGGYGHREAAGDKITFGTMTVVDVPGMIDAVIGGTSLAPHVTQPVVWDDALAVSGGHLVERASGALAIIGGHRFDGEYSGGAVQTYTEAVRTLLFDASGFAGAEEITDAELHRRDGNVAPLVLASGEIVTGIYGGVFKPEMGPDANGAYLNPLVLDATGITLASGFIQHVGHYTSPVLPLYSSETGTTHTVFFGGTNQFTWDDDLDDWIEPGNPPFIPFTDDIGTVSYTGGVWSETRMDVRMPGLLGTNASFFLDPALAFYADEIVDFDELDGATRVGWIVGGIEAGSPSFGLTYASDRVFEVSVSRFIAPNTEGSASATLTVSEAAPNPSRGTTRVDVTLDAPQALRAEVFDVTGRRVAVLHDGPLAAGTHGLTWEASGAAPGLYLVRIAGASGDTVSRRVVLAR